MTDFNDWGMSEDTTRNVQRVEHPEPIDSDVDAVAMGHARITGAAVEANHTILANVTAVISAGDDGEPSCRLSVATRNVIPTDEILKLLAEAVDQFIQKERRR